MKMNQKHQQQQVLEKNYVLNFPFPVSLPTKMHARLPPRQWDENDEEDETQ